MVRIKYEADFPREDLDVCEDGYDYVGILEDGRIFWAWTCEFHGVLDLEEWVDRYLGNPMLADMWNGAAVYNSIEELREELRKFGRTKLAFDLDCKPIIWIAGKLVTLEEAVRKVFNTEN